MGSSLYAAVQELGVGNALLYWSSRVLQLVSFGQARLLKYLIVAQPVAEQNLAPRRRGQSILVTEADARTVQETDFGRPPEVIAERLRIGSRCLIATREGRTVGFQWFTTSDYPEDEVRCVFELRPQDRCAWDFDIFVIPEARVQPVFPRLWDRCNELLREQGIDLSLSRINAFNTASLRAHSRLGAQVIGSAVFVTAGRWQLAWLPSTPRLHLSRVRVPRLPASQLARQAQKRT